MLNQYKAFFECNSWTSCRNCEFFDTDSGDGNEGYCERYDKFMMINSGGCNNADY